MIQSVLKYKGIPIVNFTKLGYVYTICKEVDNKLIHYYIGMTTKHYADRIDEHLESLSTGFHHNIKLQELFNSKELLDFSIMNLETVIASNVRDLIILLRYKEKEAIKMYNPICNIIHNKPNVKSKDKTIKNITILKRAIDYE